LLVEGIVKAFFLLIPLLAAAAPQKDEWFMAGKEGSCFPLSMLAKMGDDLKDVQSPYQLVEKMRAAGEKADLKEHKAGTRPAVEVQVPSRNLHVMFVKAAQCGKIDSSGGEKAPKAKAR
jgi:hypothetical protein